MIKKLANTQNLFLFISFLVVFAIIYWPTLTKNYAFADDYYVMSNRVFQSNWPYEIITEGALQARPLNGALVAIVMSACKSLGDYVFFHAFTIFELTILAYLTCKLLIRCGWTKIQSFFLTTSLLSLPPLQVILCWGVTTFFVLSSILALLSIKLVIDDKNLSRNPIRSSFLPFLFLLMALAIYQPWAMFYWVAAAICLSSYLFTREQKRAYLIRFLIVFSLAAASDFLLLRVAKSCFSNIAVSPERTHLTHSIVQKFGWFCTGPLVDALNFNYLMISDKLAILLGAFIVIGLWLYFKSEKKWQNVLDWLIAISFIPLSYLPNLAIAECYYTYRTELGLVLLLLFYTYLSARAFLNTFWKAKSDRLLTLVIVSTSIINMVVSHNHVVDFFINPQLQELNLFRAQLRGDFGKEKQLHPIYSERADTTAPFNRHDEFGMPSLACPWIRNPTTTLIRAEINKE